MINNPLGMLANVVKQGMNPQTMLMQMSQSNPRIRQFMSMVNGKTPQELQNMAQNIANERGVNLNSIMQQLGFR